VTTKANTRKAKDPFREQPAWELDEYERLTARVLSEPDIFALLRIVDAARAVGRQ
jgi:hypothetical protein